MTPAVSSTACSQREACPPENDVADFAAGGMEPERRARVEIHLDACQACRRVVAEIVASETAAGSSPSAPSATGLLAPGATLGRYVVRSFLGRGGMATVYRAHDPMLLRDVALKVIDVGSARAGDVRRWVREARAVASLEHPNVVSLYDVGEVDGTAFLAMELVEGDLLRALVGREGVTLDARLDCLVAIARALAAAHARGLVHRDIKPENVIVGAGGACKVLDFGLARQQDDGERGPLGEPITRDGVVVGTPLYMSPEQLRGEPLDGRTDQFAWGVVAYELLSGQRPWAAKERGVAVVSEILTRDPVSLDAIAADVSPTVAAVVSRALRKDPGERFASMGELLSAFDEARNAPRAEERADAASASGPAVLVVSASGEGTYVPAAARRAGIARPAVLALVLGAAIAAIAVRAVRVPPAPVARAAAASLPASPSSSPAPVARAAVSSSAPSTAAASAVRLEGPAPSSSVAVRPVAPHAPKPPARREHPRAPSAPSASATPERAPPIASGANGAPILEAE